MGLLLRSDDTTPGGAGVREYSYDPLRQLREVTESGGPALEYTYDRNFNLTGLGDTGAALHHDDAARPYRLTGMTPAAGSLEEVGHDLNGNVASRGAQRFEYDYKSALTRFEDGRGLVAEYSYDPFGARVSKVVDDGRGGVSRTNFLGRHAEVRDGTATLFAHVGDLRVAVLGEASTRYMHPDPLGTTSFFTDEAGVKVAAIAYKPFGNVAASSGDIDQRCFGTHTFDAESGLYHMQRRHYDPATARFLQPDPIAVLRPERYLTIPRAFHPYAYVGNDPMNNADPNGMSFWSVVGAIAGFLVGPIGYAVSVMSVAYIAATGDNALGEFALGFMIGLNAAVNAALAGPVLGAIGLLASFEGIAGNSAYQAILGWSSWLMPTSWIATGLGLAVFTTGLVIAGVTFNQWKPAHINGFKVDWGTGSIVTHGGAFGPFPNSKVGGYNLGNFIYLNQSHGINDSLAHEGGHTLNNAAFGGIFHWIGALDENVWPFENGQNAFSEKVADSHDPTNTNDPDAWYMLWA